MSLMSEPRRARPWKNFRRWKTGCSRQIRQSRLVNSRSFFWSSFRSQFSQVSSLSWQ